MVLAMLTDRFFGSWARFDRGSARSSESSHEVQRFEASTKKQRNEPTRDSLIAHSPTDGA